MGNIEGIMTENNPGDDKRKHVEFIQAAIARMAGNSFVIKGWSLTIAAADFSRQTVGAGLAAAPEPSQFHSCRSSGS